MASGASELKVRIGFLFDEKALAGIERQMRSTGQRLSKLGSDMTLAISAPLAGLGIAAIKSAGDLESLTLALKSQTGSAASAQKELGLLNEAAKNPGLGLEQAVRGSVRLQGVGLAADQAREVLIQMGNAIASTGGSAQELDNVTKQFAQMISKGRVLQEDVSVLSENMPGLAQLMQKAFGTSSVNAIQKMGVSGKDFVLQISKAAEALPRVEGGIKNNIGNAIDSLKISAGKLGLAINNAFDVSGAIDRFASFVLTAADAFANLNDGAKQTILSIAGVAVATGPVLKVFGTLKTGGAEVVRLWRSDLVPAAQAVATWGKAVAEAFNALNFATRAFILIGVVTAIAALANEMGYFNRELTTAEKAQQAVNSVIGDAEKEANKETYTVRKLIDVINNENATREEKAKALEKLKSIAPEYFGQLAEENGKVIGLAASYEAYANSIRVAARAKKSQDRLVQIDEQKQQILEEQKKLQEELNALQSAAPAKRKGFNTKDINDSAILNSSASEQGAIANRINAGKQLLEQLRLEEEDLNKKVKEGYDQAAKAENANAEAIKKTANASEAAAKAAADKAAALEEAKKMAEKYRDVLKDIQAEVNKAKLFGEDSDIAKVDALKKAMENLIDAGFKPASKEIQNLKKEWDALTAKPKALPLDNIPGRPLPGSVQSINPTATPLPNAPDPMEVQKTKAQQIAEDIAKIQDQIQTGNAKFSESFAAASKLVTDNGTLMGQVFLGMGDAISQAALSGETSFAKLGLAAAGAAAKIIRAYIQQGVAAAVAKALSSFPFPFNIAAGAAAGGLAAALFTKAVGSIGLKGFARGTSFAPGGTALVGEKGPELINLPRGSKVFPTPQTNRMLDGIGSGGVNVSGEFRIQGTDLVVVLERAQNKNQRFR